MFLAALLCLASWPAVAVADDCDAGADCDGDGGTDDDGGVDDAPPADGSVRVDGGMGLDGGTVGQYDECSCDAFIASSEGDIHVCTESFEPSVCRGFGCNRGTVRSRACPRGGVELCCEMEIQGLKTHLYEDCDHPNCVSGFREQCRDFGGSILEGACEAPEPPDRIVNDEDDDDSSGFCAVRVLGGGSGSGAGWVVVMAVAVLGVRRRRG